MPASLLCAPRDALRAIGGGALALALALGLQVGSAGFAGDAFAQAKKTAPKPAEQPAQPSAQPAQPPNNKVELKPTQPEWTKVCGNDDVAKKEICYTTRDFGVDPSQPPVLALAVYDVKGDKQKIVRMLLPVGLLLRPGFRYSVDGGATADGSFEICFPNGCFAESKVAEPAINTMKKGTVLNVFVKNQVNNEVHFIVPLDGFGKAFDGAAIDPKVLQEQQKKLQDELQKRAEEERKRLEGAAAPAAPAAPAPAAPK